MTRIKSKFNDEWGKCIRELLDTYKLSPRKAEEHTDGVVSDTHISGMYHQNKVPPYETAKDFLGAFILAHPESKEIAIKCMNAAGHPIPDEWLKNPVEAVNHALRATVPNLSEFSRKQILDLVKEVSEEVDAEE
jgi:hypothetical protein